jgi:cytidylate kinase
MTCPRVITIDGPGASGKTTVGQAVAQRLGYDFFDSGVLYRALTWLALQRGVDPADSRPLAALAGHMHVQIQPPTVPDGRQYTVLIDGDDATWQLRAPAVEAHVSLVSSFPAVRQALLAAQRRLAARGRIVMVGRDIGTVVLPDAELKLFLTASVQERARRRWQELRDRGVAASYPALLGELRRRDERDSRRSAAPLRPAADAIYLDSDGLTLEEEVAIVLRLIAQRCQAAQPRDA